MRRIYTCLLELADASSAAPRVARALTKRWVGRAYGGWPEHAPERWQPEPGVTVRWRLLDDPQRTDEAFELVWTRPHAQDPTLWRRATVQITTTRQRRPGPGARAARVGRPQGARRAGAARPPPGAGRRARARGRVRRRRLAGRRARAHASVRRGPPDLDAFVRGDRRLPVVLVAPDAHGSVRADVTRFADDLVALAHVVVLDSAPAVAALDAELGAGRARRSVACGCSGRRGARRTRRGHHPIWRAEEVAGPDGPRPRVAEMLADLVVGAATLRVEGDPLVERLARSQDTVDQQERRSRAREPPRPRCSGDRAAAEELIAEYQSELSRSDEQVYLLEAGSRARTRAAGTVRAGVPHARHRWREPNVARRRTARWVRWCAARRRAAPPRDPARGGALGGRVALRPRGSRRGRSRAARRGRGRWAAGALRVDFGTACRDAGWTGCATSAPRRSRSSPRTTSARTAGGRSCSDPTSAGTGASSCASTASWTRRSGGSWWATWADTCDGPRPT